ncbi:MAG: (Fe-S)-binding protein [Candidatus Bathyarchaeota archaeon]
MQSLKDYEKIVASCVRCSNCKFIPALQVKSQRFSTVCPAIDRYNFHAYSGGGKMIIAYSLLKGRISYSDELIKVIYRCTLCGGCDISCKYFFDLEPLEVISELRFHCVENEAGPMPQHKRWITSIKQNHNPYGESHEKRFSWMPSGVKPRSTSETVYFVGCTPSYRRNEIARATIKILDVLDVNYMILEADEYCCGSPMFRVGAKKEALKLMSRNVETLKKYGIKRIITSCAGCYSMFKVEYPKYLNTNFEALHVSELLDFMIKSGELKFVRDVPLKVTYHDPCHLGRNSEPYTPWKGELVKVVSRVYIPVPPKPIRRGTNGVYEAPRNILRNIPGLKLIEMERIREYAYCCGAGGGVKSAFPDFALWVAGKRIEEAKATGAEALVSCCPFCATNFKDALKERSEKMNYYDITELVLMAIGGDA